ncbi:hypothetical protein [Streptomyces sp. NPDC051994]|uniref:hypothetical protein n=1 Tax=unclassified Streptomyces TaxID=2593676 RepID=UPI003431414A
MEYFGIDARDWLRQIIDICDNKLRQLGLNIESNPPIPEPWTQTEPVLQEISLVRDELALATDRAHRTDPAVLAMEALQEVVSTVDPDLGFRLLLTILNTYQTFITQDQYERFKTLGEYVGYGEFHVFDVEWLTRQR